MRTSLSRHHADPTANGIAQALGWFSIGLGALEILAPRKMARTFGMPRSRGVLAGYGVREIASGVGLLWAKDRRPWIWSRVGGDALDVATLATGLGASNPRRGTTGLAMAMALGVTVLDIFCAARLSAAPGRAAPTHDYSARSGWPHGAAAARGAARDVATPRDMQAPPALRHLNGGEQPG